MPELIRQLAKADGTMGYSVDPDLQDYPVFVSVKSGAVADARKLIAAAVHGKWVVADKRYRLSSVKPTKGEGFEAFERDFKIAAAGKNVPVSAKEAFNMAPGEILRFGEGPGAYFKPLPAGSRAETELKFRRFGPKVFELTGGGDFEFEAIPDEVRKALGPVLKKTVLTSEEQQAFNDRMTDPDKMKLDWRDIMRTDPVAAIAAPVMNGLAAQLPMDFAVALPDFSIFPPMKAKDWDRTVESYLRAYAMTVDWEMVDGALVGRLPVSERLMPSQTKRSVLAKLLAAMGSQGVATTDVLGQYVSNQRPYASESWVDVMMLVLAGKAFDQEYVGDYPHNIRLYVAFTPADWSLLRTGEVFQASEFTPRVQSLLAPLLVQSRRVMDGNSADPATWPNLSPAEILVKAELLDEAVLIGFTGFGASVDTVGNAGANYTMRKSELKREPLYQPAMRRKLKLTFICRANGATVDTGFSEVIPDPKQKAVVWTQLPEETAKDFKSHIGN